MEATRRLHYIDLLRGVTMILVVYSHVNYKLFQNYPESCINNIFITFRMPLFFFISGFFLYSSKLDFSLLKKRTVNRIIRQLYPTIIFLFIYCLIVGQHIGAALAEPFKAGYWFTFVSVEMFLVTGPLVLLMNHCKLSNRSRLGVFAPIMVLSAALCVVARKLEINTTLWNGLSMDPLLHFLPYCLLGCVFKMYYDRLLDSIVKFRYLVLAVLLFCTAIVFPRVSLHNLVPAVCGIYILHYLCYKVKEGISENRIGKFFIKIGTSTLEIYLLHYIVIYYLAMIPSIIRWGGEFCNTVWELPIYLIISILIASTCLSVVWVLKRLRIYCVFFPETMSHRLSVLLSK